MKSTVGRPTPKNDAVRKTGRQFGEILVEQGRLSPSEVVDVLAFANARQLRFGDAALQMKLLTQGDIDGVLAKQFNYPILPRVGDYSVAAEVISAYQPQSSMLEPLRALRSQLNLRWVANSPRRILAVTSPARSEGRTWLAANLATMFAQLGESTLLIDGDMRNPRQHELFRISNAVGLSALLTGRAGREMARRIHPQLRLAVLPAGILPPNPQELLERQVFEVVLSHFAQQFSIVIIDTPPITQAADAQVIASRAGAAIMLVRRNFTQQTRLVEACQSFTLTGVNVIGSVINSY